MCLSAFVSALGSHEMGRHKLPIIIIVINSRAQIICKTVTMEGRAQSSAGIPLLTRLTLLPTQWATIVEVRSKVCEAVTMEGGA